MPSLQNNPMGQAHSRMPECDDGLTFQVKPDPIDRVVTPSTPHVDLFATHLHHKLQLYVSPVPDQHAWDIDALNINWLGLVAYAYLPTALLHRVVQKIRQCYCHVILIVPGWPGMAWFWDLVQLSTESPLLLPASKTLLKQPHDQVFQNNPQYLNLHAWSLGVDSSKNKASLRENCCPSKVINKDRIQIKVGPF